MSTITTTSCFPLHGQWKRAIGGRDIDFVPVPGCYPATGECVLSFTFPHPCSEATEGARFILNIEGVLSSAEFTCNGQVLGTAGPFVPYRFEIPASLLCAENTITARIRDISEPFGTTPGRRYDAGIIRDIWLECRPAAFIESVAFHPQLNADCSSAECTVAVEINGTPGGAMRVLMQENEYGRVLADVTLPAGEVAHFSADWPQLWSARKPNLYTLRVQLLDSGDQWEELVGFCRIETRGQSFYVNNQRVTLKGVCRHEFTSLHSYSPTYEEVYRELALIKHSGFNYIRLVHSPQSRIVPRIAAELGLYVTEETGTCWHNLDDDIVAAPALETLARLVKRDRACPSIFAWYIYNECEPSVRYAKKAMAICRELDPGRLVSAADCCGDFAKHKAMVKEAGLSFYGVNAYYIWENDYRDRAQHYTDLPFIYTEWGGAQLLGNERQLRQVCRTFARQLQLGAEPGLAGFAFWAWSDYEEYSRAEPATIDGWTVEGLLDKRAEPRPDLQIVSHCAFDADYQPLLFIPPIEVLQPAPQRREYWSTVDLVQVTGEQTALEAALCEMRKRFTYRMPIFGRIAVAGIDFVCRDSDGNPNPLLLGAQRPQVVIPVNKTVSAVAVFGHVALIGGYPMNDIFSVFHPDQEKVTTLGQPAATYTFVFADGSEEQPLQHGIHISRGNNICRWWKTAPRTPETLPGAQTVLSETYETLRYDFWEHEFSQPRFLKEIRWTLADEGAVLAMQGISVRENG